MRRYSTAATAERNGGRVFATNAAAAATFLDRGTTLIGWHNAATSIPSLLIG